MKKIISLIAILSSLFFFQQCSTEVDLYADYKDITIIYGLLDVDDDTTWIKITKAFTGPGNALEFAKDPDSSNYPYLLDVKLTGYKNGDVVHTYTLDTLTVRSKDVGDTLFYYPNQLMYYTAEPLSADAEYKLTVNNKGKVLSSETNMIGDFGVSITPPRYIIFDSDNDKDITVHPAINGKRYELNLVFNYKELLPGSQDTLYKSIGFSLGSKKVDNPLQPPLNLIFSYLGEVFYKTLDNDLAKTPGIKRWSENVDIVVSCGSLVLNTYLEINGGDNSLLQEVPQYTNITDGLGIFTSRHTMVNTVLLHSNSEKKLVNDYPDLGFILQ